MCVCVYLCIVIAVWPKETLTRPDQTITTSVCPRVAFAFRMFELFKNKQRAFNQSHFFIPTDIDALSDDAATPRASSVFLKKDPSEMRMLRTLHYLLEQNRIRSSKQKLQTANEYGYIHSTSRWVVCKRLGLLAYMQKSDHIICAFCCGQEPLVYV